VTTVWEMVPVRFRVSALIAASLLFVCTGLLMSRPPGYGRVTQLLEFELALGSADSAALLGSWSESQRAAVRASLFYDLAFIASYVTLASLLCSALATALSST